MPHSCAAQQKNQLLACRRGYFAIGSSISVQTSCAVVLADGGSTGAEFFFIGDAAGFTPRADEIEHVYQCDWGRIGWADFGNEDCSKIGAKSMCLMSLNTLSVDGVVCGMLISQTRTMKRNRLSSLIPLPHMHLSDKIIADVEVRAVNLDDGHDIEPESASQATCLSDSIQCPERPCCGAGQETSGIAWS